MDILLERINELARKDKAEGLTEEEKAEREQLRKDYIIAFRGRLRGVLDTVEITSEMSVHENEINNLSNVETLENMDEIVSVTPSGKHFDIVYKDKNINEEEIRRILAK